MIFALGPKPENALQNGVRSTCWLLVAAAACEQPATAPELVECGEGTMLVGTECHLAPEPTCGDGTHLEGDACVRDDHFQLYASSSVRADGWTATELIVLGTRGDDLPSNELVIVTAEPATAGVVASPMLRLGDRGAATNFIPCTSADPVCTGTVRFSAALATDPLTPVASVDATLQPPPTIGSLAPCAGPGNIAYFDAQDFYFTGTKTLTDASAAFSGHGAANRATVQIVVPNAESYAFDIDTIKLGIPLLRSVYEHTKPIGYAAAGEPVFQLVAFYGGCEADSSVQLHEFNYDAPSNRITTLALSFTQRCVHDMTKTITGCVRFSQ